MSKDTTDLRFTMVKEALDTQHQRFNMLFDTVMELERRVGALTKAVELMSDELVRLREGKELH